MKKYIALTAAVLLATSLGAKASVIAVEHDAFAGATVIGFDDLDSEASLADQYAAQGVADFNATVLGSQGFGRTSDSFGSAHSGSNMVYFGASIQLAAPVDRVGAWIYKHNNAQYLTALDASMNVLMSVAQDAGSADSADFDFVGIQSSSANIAYVVISNKDLSADPVWNISGPTTFFDDFTFGSRQEVPEPASLGLLGLGLLGLAAARRKA